MELRDFVVDSLAQAHVRLRATCEGMTHEQMSWRPAPSANSAGYILLHVCRALDSTASRIGGRASLWDSEAWHARLGVPASLPAASDREGLLGLPVPPPEPLLAYFDASCRVARSIVVSLESSDFERPLDPAQPDVTVAARVRHILTHTNNHHGQIDFLRGLQEPAWDLPPGTGIVLPGTGSTS